jgi:hypothetical protein
MIERIALLRVKETVIRMSDMDDSSLAEKLIIIEETMMRLENDRSILERSILEKVYGQMSLELKITNAEANMLGVK